MIDLRSLALLAAQLVADPSPFAADLRLGQAGALDCADAAPVYVVQIDLRQRALQIREAVAWAYPGDVPLHEAVFRVFPAAMGPVELVAKRRGHRLSTRLDGTLLSVPLRPPLRPGQMLELQLQLSTTVPTITAPTRLPSHINATQTGAYGATPGITNLGYALPQLTRFADGDWDRRALAPNGEHAVFDASHFHVTLHTAAQVQVATTGTPIHERVGPDGRETTVVAALVREFAVEASPHFTIARATHRGTEIRVFSPAGPHAAHALLREASGALVYFSDRFGPLPYRQLDIVDAPVRIAMGTEFPGLVTVDASWSAGIWTDDPLYSWSVAHEVAHQWWYGRVGSDGLAAPWVDESLTSGVTAAYWAHSRGPAALAQWQRSEHRASAASLAALDLPALAADLPGSDYDLAQYAEAVYGRGAGFVDAVRHTLGDQAFYRALRGYHQRFACRQATGSDLLDAWRAEAADPMAIDRLYQQWMAPPAASDRVMNPP